jgi:hypothetical protein
MGNNIQVKTIKIEQMMCGIVTKAICLLFFKTLIIRWLLNWNKD